MTKKKNPALPLSQDDISTLNSLFINKFERAKQKDCFDNKSLELYLEVLLDSSPCGFEILI